MMQKYLELLKYDRNKGYNKHRGLFFSINSEMLYNELSVCIEKIKENQELKNGITVTREYYRKNYDGQKCVFMLDLGIVMSDIFIMLLYVIVGVIIGILAKARKALDKYIEKSRGIGN